MYTSHYTMISKYGNFTRLLKIKNKLKIGGFYKYSREEFFPTIFTRIVPLPLVGHLPSHV